MKKLLSILGTMTLIGTASTGVVACGGTPDSEKNTKINISNKITNTIDLEKLDENTQEYFLEKLQTKLVAMSELSTITTSDYDVYKAGKGSIAIQDRDIIADTSLNIKIVAKGNKFKGNKDNIAVSYTKKDLHKQDTIYIDQNGNQQTTSEPDLSDINSREVIQIGFYQNDEEEIQVVRMPKTIEKVPNQLPSEITSLTDMFYDTQLFNQDLSNGKVDNVTNMSNMFYDASSFNGNISSGKVDNVTNMRNMFDEASLFNQDLSNGNTSNVTDMHSMFEAASLFNQDLSNGKVDKVTNMSNMFSYAENFNQDLSNGKVDKVTEHSNFAQGSGIQDLNKLPKFKN